MHVINFQITASSPYFLSLVFFAVLKYWHSTAMSLHYPCNNCTITVLPLHSTPTSRSKPQQQNQQHVTMSILTSKSASSTPISKLIIYTNMYVNTILNIYANNNAKNHVKSILTFTPIFSTLSNTQISTPTQHLQNIYQHSKPNSTPTSANIENNNLLQHSS